MKAVSKSGFFFWEIESWAVYPEGTGTLLMAENQNEDFLNKNE